MTTEEEIPVSTIDLAAIADRDNQVPWAAALAPLQVTDEYVWQALEDRSNLLALLADARRALEEARLVMSPPVSLRRVLDQLATLPR